MNYWLMKSEPGTFSIDDLMARPGGIDHWDGVRNYQARNILRDKMKAGDRVLFYHSGKDPAVVGLATVVRAGYPDHTAWDPESDHPDARSTPENPVWYMVDIRFERKFDAPVRLAALRGQARLKEMMLLKKGMRLSVQPVTRAEYDLIITLAQAGGVETPKP